MRLLWRLILVAMIVPSVFIGWLGLSDDGLKWGYHQLQSRLPGVLSVQSLEGSLFGPISIVGLEYIHDQQVIKNDRLELHWSPIQLIFSKVEINKLVLQKLSVTMPETVDPAAGSDAVPQPALEIPINISIQNLDIQDMQLQQGVRVTPIKSIHASAESIDGLLQLAHLTVVADAFEFSVQGEIEPANKYQHDVTVEWLSRLPGGDVLKGQGGLSGNIESTAIKQQLSTPTSIQVQANLINPLQQLRWDADIRVSGFDHKQWRYDLPALKGSMQFKAKGDLQNASVTGKLSGSQGDIGPFNAEYRLHWLEQQILKVDEINLRLKKDATWIKARGEWQPGAKGGAVKLSLDWENLKWPINQPAVAISGKGKGTIAGSIDAYQFTLNSTRPLPALPESEWLASGAGNQRGLHFKRFQVKALEGEFSGRASVGWDQQISWAAEIQGKSINPESLSPDWPGKLDFSASSQGRYADNQLQSDIEITRLQGKLKDYPFALNALLNVRDLPAQINTTSKSDSEIEAGRLLTIRQLQLTSMGSELQAKGDVTLASMLKWNVDAAAQNVNPEKWYQEWPGQLNISMSSQGQLQDGQFTSDVNIKRMDGRLRDYPVMLESRFRIQNDAVNIASLSFNSGGSQLIAEGVLGDKLDLSWTVNSQDMGELYPDAKGQIQAKGELSGFRDKPAVKARITAKNLGYTDYLVGSIEGDVSFDVFNPQFIVVDMQMMNVQLGDQHLDQLEIRGDANKLNLMALSAIGRGDFELTGTATQDGWSGLIQRADISSKMFQSWQLRQPVAAQFQQQALTVGQGCWTNVQNAASACGDFSTDQSGWQTEWAFLQIPLQIAEPWLSPDIKLPSKLNGRAKLRSLEKRLLGEAKIELLPGQVHIAILDGELEQWDYQGGVVNLQINDRGLQSDLRFQLNEQELMVANLQLPGVDLLNMQSSSQAIKAEAQLQLTNLALLSLVVPEVQGLKGDVSVDLNVSGSIGQPKLVGKLQLQQGVFSVPRLGVTVRNIELTGRSEGLDKIEYTITGESGDGSFQVSGHSLVGRENEWTTELSIKGKDLEISRIPEATVTASPNLLVKVKPYFVEISGEVDIPYAHIEPRDMSSATRVSSDVVIVGQEQTVNKKWAIVTRVKLTLGQRVHFFGFGLEGKLGGSLLLLDDPGLPTRATGEINVTDGVYRNYGQKLTIESGRLLFTGGPLVNPGLDVRSVRKVNTITAGILVRGNVDNPRIELFSTPAMGQTDILSYLLLGRPLESASDKEGAMMAKASLALGLSGGDKIARKLRERFGLDEMRIESSDSGDQASLVMGRYLSPKLYVSYGIGLIEAFNTFNVRYQISEKWQLKAVSGESHGADIIYTLER